MRVSEGEREVYFEKNRGFFNSALAQCCVGASNTHMRPCFCEGKRKKSLFPFQTQISECSVCAGVKFCNNIYRGD